MGDRGWTSVEPDIWVYGDSCQVYALRGRNDGWLIFNAGTGQAASRLADLGAVREPAVLLTHHFRDHTAGAAQFRREGARIHAPYWERDHLSGLQPSFRQRETRMQYDMAWDHFAPI